MSTGQMVVKLQKHLKLRDREIAELMGVAKQTIGAYRNEGKNPKRDKIDRLAIGLAEQRKADPDAIRIWILAGRNEDPPLSPKKIALDNETGVYHNEPNENSNPLGTLQDAARKYASPLTTRVNVLVGKGSTVWSAKGARRYEMKVENWATEGDWDFVEISDTSLGLKNHRAILGFKRSDYPRGRVYLLCRSVDNPDQRTIRYLDPAKGFDHFYSPDPTIPPVAVRNWEIVGYAKVLIRYEDAGEPGEHRGEPEVHRLPRGIGPDSNI